MKRIILSLLLLGSLPIFSQVKLISSSKDDMKTLSDSLTANAKSNYQFYKENNQGKYKFSLYYKNSADEFDPLTVYFGVKYTGENQDLQITGTPEYYLSNVRGKFLDLYPFWNKYIDKQHTQEEILKKAAVFVIIDNKRYVFSKSNDIWTISAHDVIK